MKLIDSYILARTKRKTRRIRTVLVVIVSSLLFALLFGLATTAQGLVNAGKQVGDVGFNARNLASVSPTSGLNFNYPGQAKIVEGEMIAELRARKVKVTDQTKQDLGYQAELNRRMNALMVKQQTEAIKRIERQVRALGSPTAVYHFEPLPLTQLALYQPDPAVDPLVKDLQDQEKTGGGKVQSFMQGGDALEFYNAEADMFRTQIQPGQTLGWKPGQPYPLIVSYTYLEKLSKRSFAKLSTVERNKGYRELINRYTGYKLPYCYRNPTAQDQLRAAIHYNHLAETDKDAATKPITIPVCGGLDQGVLKKLELISDDDPTGTKPLFPPAKVPAPETKQISFTIVGFVPSQQQFGSTDIITQTLAGLSVLPTGPLPAIVPSEVVAADGLLQTVTTTTGGFAYTSLYADFATAADHKKFVGQGCSGDDCVKGSKPYIASFGNISIALEGVFRFFSKLTLIAGGVIMVIAALMIMFTISKVIADSVKEIAVFRSLGARRRDIAQIYYTYGMMLAGSAAAVAVLLAVVGAYVLTMLYDDKIAQGLIQAAGAYNTEVHVTLLGINLPWLVSIIVALIVAAFIGISLPVLASLRRKLITILREE